MTGKEWNIKNSYFSFQTAAKKCCHTFKTEKPLSKHRLWPARCITKIHIQQIGQMTTLKPVIGQRRLTSAGGLIMKSIWLHGKPWLIWWIWKGVYNYNIGGYMWPTIPYQILIFLIPFQLNLLTNICDTNTERRLSRCSNLLVYITNHHI